MNVPRGVPSHTVLLVGDGGAPQITATGPGGAVVRSGEATSTGFTATVGNLSATYLVLTDPQRGDWTIVPNQGSPAITQTLTSSGFKPLSVTGKVRGSGRKHTINYRLRNRGHGQRVTFVERGAFGTNVIGSTSKARGKLKYTIADARGGRRRVLALVETDGLQTDRKTIGSYRAPGPVKPGKVRRLRAKRKGKNVIVTWRGARGAQRYSVTVRGRHGTSLGRFVGRKARKVRFGHVRRDERLRIVVYGVSKKLRRGGAARKNLPAARR